MENVLIALIGAFQAISLPILAFILKRLSTVRNDARATKDQIVNHHPETPNFRDENDRRHAETKSWFRLLFNRQEKLFQKVESMETTQTELIGMALENRERIERTEDTLEIKKGTS